MPNSYNAKHELEHVSEAASPYEPLQNLMRAKRSLPGGGTQSSSTLAVSVAAMGVVFGDIGTSPLYALRACFSDVAGVSVDAPSVLGILSLIFWSLLLVISVKYVGIILRADHHGEGGVLALTTRVINERPLLGATAIGTVGLIGCALFYGDGVITPAVTVLGALEGLGIAAPAFAHAVLPLSIIALLSLFALQRRGTGAIGRLFGPMMLVWFLVLALLGIHSIVLHPSVLVAMNPVYAFAFFAEHSIVAFAVFRRGLPYRNGRRSPVLRSRALPPAADRHCLVRLRLAGPPVQLFRARSSVARFS